MTQQMTFEAAAEAMRRDCQPYLCMESLAGGSLYRGAGVEAPEAFEGRVIRDRRPKNMPGHLHAAADQWFSTQFGVRYRGAGLFCTGDKTQAIRHGKPYKIAPIGGFQFCWSPKVKDLHEWCEAHGYLDRSEQDLVIALSELDYRDEDFLEAVASGNEVMVACARYWAIAEPF